MLTRLKSLALAGALTVGATAAGVAMAQSANALTAGPAVTADGYGYAFDNKTLARQKAEADARAKATQDCNNQGWPNFDGTSLVITKENGYYTGVDDAYATISGYCWRP